MLGTFFLKLALAVIPDALSYSDMLHAGYKGITQQKSTFILFSTKLDNLLSEKVLIFWGIPFSKLNLLNWK